MSNTHTLLSDVEIDLDETPEIEIARPYEKYRAVCIQVLVLIALTLQTSVFTLVRRYSQAVLAQTYSFGSVLVVGEVMKLVTTVVAICFRIGDERSQPHSVGSTLARNLATIVPMTVPAFIYLIMNILSFYSLARVDAATFSVIFQLKLVTTAFFSRALLGKHFPWKQRRAMALVVLGVIQITMNTMPRRDRCDHSYVEESVRTEVHEYVKGVIAAIGEVTLSGLCTVYMEKMFKDKTTELTIWDRNFQLAFSSIPVYLLVVFATDSPNQSFFHGWTSVTTFLAFMSAFGGILVALCLKYTDSILKTFASTGAILVTTAASYLLLNGPMNTEIFIASTVVILGVVGYQFE